MQELGKVFRRMKIMWHTIFMRRNTLSSDVVPEGAVFVQIFARTSARNLSCSKER